MFVFFHVAVPLLVMEIPYLQSRLSMQRFALIIGSMIPDILDKPVALLGYSSGRGFFHAPFLWLAVWFALYVMIKNKSIANGIGIGAFFHIFLDIPAIPWFWPFVQYDFFFTYDHFGAWLYALTHNPIVISTEIFGLLFLIFLTFRYQLLFDWNRIKAFLWTPMQIKIASTQKELKS
jgi:hypothetical protein